MILFFFSSFFLKALPSDSSWTTNPDRTILNSGGFCESRAHARITYAPKGPHAVRNRPILNSGRVRDGAAPEPLSPKPSPTNYDATGCSLFLSNISSTLVADHVILLMAGCRLQATLIRKLRSAHSATKSPDLPNQED